MRTQLRRTVAVRERLHANHLALLEKLDANHRELLAARAGRVGAWRGALPVRLGAAA